MEYSIEGMCSECYNSSGPKVAFSIQTVSMSRMLLQMKLFHRNAHRSTYKDFSIFDRTLYLTETFPEILTSSKASWPALRKTLVDPICHPSACVACRTCRQILAAVSVSRVFTFKGSYVPFPDANSTQYLWANGLHNSVLQIGKHIGAIFS